MSELLEKLAEKEHVRKCNFSAGPAAIPQSVMTQVRDELLDYHGEGTSIIEVSHRGEAFMRVAEEADADLRDLLKIPVNYKILFIQGGARGQFAAVPMNLKGDKRSADYVNSGYWAQSAIKEAQRYLDVNVVADGKKSSFHGMPEQAGWRVSRDAAYLHYTPNETIGGLEFPFVPDSGDVPLVADMSSSILSRPVDVSQFGVIYAGAQKNIGPSGMTVVIVREDLLDHGLSDCPSILDYKLQVAKDSMYNTPPTFSWYVAGLVFKWLKAQGGVEAINKLNERKASKLYRVIDESGFYQNTIDARWRSRMNIPFMLANQELDETFLKASVREGLLYLKGHRAVGGMRASLYNAVPEAHVDALIAFMTEFERTHG